MRINEVKTAVKLGDFFMRDDGSPNKIDLKYLNSIDRTYLIDDIARVYLFIVDGEIKKIGGSSSKGGIKATMSFYINAMTGSPGPPRFILHLLIHEELSKGKKVELYNITSPKTLAVVKGLFESKKIEIASFKEMENLCKKDYLRCAKKYPSWNFQENRQSYPTVYERKYTEYRAKRLAKKD